MIILIAIIHGLIPIIGGLIGGAKGARGGAIISAVLAVFTGALIFTPVDLIGVAIGYCLAPKNNG